MRWQSGASKAIRKRLARAASISMCRSCEVRCKSRSGHSRRARRRNWPGVIRKRLPQNIESPSGPRIACWSTTTRMPGDARWLRFIRCGQSRVRRFRLRWNGAKSRTESKSKIFGSTTCPHASKKRATCSGRCFCKKAECNWSDFYTFPADGSEDRQRHPERTGMGVRA